MLRSVYRGFKERVTPQLTELLRTNKAEMLRVVEELDRDPHHLEPLPASLGGLGKTPLASGEGQELGVMVTNSPLVGVVSNRGARSWQ